MPDALLAPLRARVDPPNACSEVAAPLLPRAWGIHHHWVLSGKWKSCPSDSTVLFDWTESGILSKGQASQCPGRLTRVEVIDNSWIWRDI